MGELFAGWAVALMLAAMCGVVARTLKQPPLLGYMLAGIILSSTGWANRIGGVEMMGQLGVTLLLFLAGLELPLTELKKMGKVALITGIGQILVTTALGYGLAMLLGFNQITSLFLGVGSTFGSTILVVKLLSEKGDLQSLYGKITMGYLLVQDFVAIGLLVMLSGVVPGKNMGLEAGLIIVKGLAMAGLAVVLSETVMKRVMNYLGHSGELLFISSIAWCVAVAAIAAAPMVGFSLEIGGFLAGLSLAAAVEQTQIIARVKPVRDFFLTWFFLALGAKINPGQWLTVWRPALVFSGYVLMGNPLIVMAILGALGYRKRTAFLASLAVGQVSEFSLILITGAVSRGQIPGEILALVTAVTMITMTLSTYMLWYSHQIYRWLAKGLGIFERKAGIQETGWEKSPEGHVIVFGYHRIGNEIKPALDKLGKEVVVVDFNPEIVEKLNNEGIKAIYGDMADQEVYEVLGLAKAKLIISTVPDIRDSLLLLSELGRIKHRPVVVLTATDGNEAKRLYQAGADYVLVPHSVGGEFLAQLMEIQESHENYLVNYGKKHYSQLIHK